MKRATITLPTDLEQDLQAYIDRLEAAPSLTAIIQVALRQFLDRTELDRRGYRPPQGPLEVRPAERGSGHGDVSIDHDRHATEP